MSESVKLMRITVTSGKYVNSANTTNVGNKKVNANIKLELEFSGFARACELVNVRATDMPANYRRIVCLLQAAIS